jgi:ABC-type transport system substrate-binding protein
LQAFKILLRHDLVAMKRIMEIYSKTEAMSGAFFLALCLSLAPCDQLAAQTKPKTVFVGHGVDLESLNPYWHNTTANYAVWRHFLEPLAEYDFAKRKYTGILAESWSGSEKGWTFKLHRKVKFHNGAEMTASDVIYSLKRSIDPKLSRQVNLARIIQSIQAPDPHTVVITTTKPVVSLLEYLDNAYILSEAAAKESADEATFGKKPIGTGPFKFVEWVRGERVEKFSILAGRAEDRSYRLETGCRRRSQARAARIRPSGSDRQRPAA